MSTTPFTSNPAPGFRDHPDHVIELERVADLVRIKVDGVQIAESAAALILHETNHTPVYYIPLEDVDDAFLRNSPRITRCPFKGKATYWNIAIGEHEVDNALWAYETPYDEMLELAGLVGFYSSKVSIETDSSH